MAASKGKSIGKIVGLGLVVAAGLGILLYEPTPDEPPPPVNDRPAKLMTVEAIGGAIERSYSGVVQAPDRVDLAFRVSGHLVQLPIGRGEVVEPGTLIAQIDPRDYQVSLARITASLDEAKAQLGAMKAGERAEVIARLENQVAAERAKFENAEIEVSRNKELLDQKVISQSEYDQAELRRDTAQEKLQAAEQELAQGKKGARQEDIDAQEAVIRGLDAQKADAENAVADTSLKAPFEGRIAKQYVENFQEIRAGQPIVSLQSANTIEIVADIPESVIAVKRDRRQVTFTVTFEALPDKVFDVEFKEAEMEADPRTQTYAITLGMDAPEDVRLLPGMPAMVQVKFRLSEDEAAGIAVPASSVFSNAKGQAMVWQVAEDRTVSQVPVETGVMSGSLILITEGIQPGDTIVTAGVHSIRPGMKVYPFVVQGERD